MNNSYILFYRTPDQLVEVAEQALLNHRENSWGQFTTTQGKTKMTSRLMKEILYEWCMKEKMGGQKEQWQASTVMFQLTILKKLQTVNTTAKDYLYNIGTGIPNKIFNTIIYINMS